MKKSIKIILASTMLASIATFAYSMHVQVEKKWLCKSGTAGWCVTGIDFADEYYCIIPTGQAVGGDCDGIVEVVIPQ